MFSKIMAPVDLAHANHLEKAVAAAGDLGKRYGAEVVFVGVTSSAPGAVAHNPEEFGKKLAGFAAEKADAYGVKTSGHVVVSHDPTADLDQKLLAAADELGADLIVMGTHIPGIADHLWASHGGAVASQSAASVMLVRG